jgi:hypothetical protein
MLKNKVATTALIMTLMFATGVGEATAQDSGAAKPTPAAVEPGHAYRLDFLVSEIDDGKKMNTRQYSMNLNATSIWCQLRDRNDVAWLGNDLLMSVRSEISNFAVPEQQGQNVRPLLRQLRINASTIVAPGKPMVMGSVDDPNSKRQFQLEVTATKLK